MRSTTGSTEHARSIYASFLETRERNLIKLTRLYDDGVLNRRIDLLLRNLFMGVGDRNARGAIAYEPHGSGTEPRAFTQSLSERASSGP